MSICTECNEDKPDHAFSFRNKEESIRQKKCKTCVAIITKKHYENNKEDYKKRQRNSRGIEREKRKSLINSLKTKCSLCEEDFPAALDFHHIDPSIKEHMVTRDVGRKRILNESKKCIILCANHHRKFHAGHKDTVKEVNAFVAQLVEAVDSKST